MTLNTLFLPLLGGFLFYNVYFGTSHLLHKQPPQTVLFWSAAIGLLSLVLARESIYWVSKAQSNNDDFVVWTLINLARPVLLTLLIGLFLGFVVLVLLEWVVAEESKTKFGVRRIFDQIRSGNNLVALLIGVLAIVVYSLLHVLPTVTSVSWIQWFIPSALIFGGLFWAKFSSMPSSSATIRLAIAALMVIIGICCAVEYWRPATEHWLSIRSPIPNSDSTGLGTAFLACLIAPIIAGVLNFVYTKNTAEYRYEKSKWPTELERLVYSAARLGKLVMLTMDDGKVYVGTPARFTTNVLTKNSYLVILPKKSGYRDKETLAVEFTTIYDSVYAAMSDEDRSEFKKILPIDDIKSAGYFDEDHYIKFSAPHKKKTPRLGPSA